MRVGLYIPLLDERPAGVGVYIEEVCSRLVALHPDVMIYTGSPNAKRAWIDPSRVREFGRSALPVVPRLEGLRRRARRLRWLGSTAKHDLQRDGVDVLFSPVQEGPLLGEVPTVMVMHDLTALKVPEAYSRATVWQTRWVVPRMLARCARVVAVSQNTRSDLLEAFKLDPARIEVIGEGCDRAIFRPRSAADIAGVRTRLGISGRYLLYAGTFSRHKNLSSVATALLQLPSDVSLVLVGRKDAGAYAEFEALVRQLGLTSRVHTPGYVTRDELAVLMSGASVFVYPSRYEGFGLAPLEAMACGAPVVASRVASLPEVVGEGGRLLTEGEAWGPALQAVLESARAEWSARAVSQSNRFHWHDAVARVLALLHDVVSRGVT